MKYLMWLKFYYGYWQYYNACSEDRWRHLMAHKKGMYCEGVRHGVTGIYAKYDPNRPPQERDWLTYEEYKAAWNPVNGNAKFFVGPKYPEYIRLKRILDPSYTGEGYPEVL